MSELVNPLQKLCYASLAFAWCWATIAGAVGLNALLCSNRDLKWLKSQVAPPTVLDINTDDILNPGIVASVASTLIAVLTWNYVTANFTKKLRGIALRTLRYQAYSLFFLATFLAAVLIPFTHLFRTGSATVRAFVGELELSPEIIKKVSESMGTSGDYRDLVYLEYVAIMSWLNVLTTYIAGFVLLAASKRVYLPAPPSGTGSSDSDMVEKGSVKHLERSEV